MNLNTALYPPASIRQAFHFLVIVLSLAPLLSSGDSAWAQQITFQTVARRGQPAPGTTAGVNYADFFLPALNAAGQSSFRADISGAGVTNASNTGIWSGAPGSVALVAREGDTAPGTAAGVNYSIFGVNGPTINAAGQSAFAATLIGAGVTFANDSGLWSGAPGSVALLARAGDYAPGTEAGVNYGSAFGNAALNSAGKSAFFAQVTGPGVTSGNGTGLWSGVPGAVALLARGGDPAPGTTAGTNYLFFSQPTMNAAGQSAFFASLTGANVTSDNGNGLWVGAPR